jgi:hypothetical protein
MNPVKNSLNAPHSSGLTGRARGGSAGPSRAYGATWRRMVMGGKLTGNALTFVGARINTSQLLPIRANIFRGSLPMGHDKCKGVLRGRGLSANLATRIGSPWFAENEMNPK